MLVDGSIRQTLAQGDLASVKPIHSPMSTPFDCVAFCEEFRSAPEDKKFEELELVGSGGFVNAVSLLGHRVLTFTNSRTSPDHL